MTALADQLDTLYRILEEEIAAYTSLQEAVERESDCLRQGSPEALMRVIHEIEEEGATLRAARERTGQIIAEISLALGSGVPGHDLSALASALPGPAQQKIRDHRRELARIQVRIQARNERNKAFAEEWQVCCRELFSILLHPLAGTPAYNRNGWTKSVQVPCALNRRV